MVSQSIRFDRSADGALGSNKAFPYIYNFVNADFDTGATFAGTIGPTIPPGTTARHIIPMREDYNFLPRWLKLTAYRLNGAIYEWWDVAPASPILFQNRLSDFGSPLTQFISVTMSFQPDDRFMMGGQQIGLAAAFPIPALLIAGEDPGIRGIKIPWMLPPQGNIVLLLTNNHATKTIIVGGCVIGWKVRI